MSRIACVGLCFALAGCGAGRGGADRLPHPPEALADIVEVSALDLSPDGSQIAFVSNASGEPELWVVPAAGGEPAQRTALREQVGEPRFSPDGEVIFFTSDRGGDERPDLFRVAARGGEPARVRETPTAEMGPALSPDGRFFALAADPDRPFRFDLHLMDAASGELRRLTWEAVNVVEPRWSHDGSLLAATRTGDDQKGELLLVDVATGTPRAIEPPVKGGILWPAAFAEDGSSLLALALNPQGFLQLATVGVASGGVHLFGPAEWDVEHVAWAGKGPIVYARNEGGPSRLYALRAPDATPVALRVPDGVVSDLAMDRAGQRVAFVLESSTSPAGAWVIDLPDGKARRVTPAGLGGVPERDLTPARSIVYPSEGHGIRALYMRPPVARLGSPAPLVVWVHGGPNSQSRPWFMPQLQALTEAGFAVLAPDYRGSVGYGRAFEDANNRDWGGGDLRDLLAGVRFLAEDAAHRGEVDSGRVAIAGGSFGGYMTLRALTATPEAWAAGVDLYGMPDLVHDYQLTKDRYGAWYETEMGTPETHGALFAERSPVHTLERVRAPLLVLHGANDSDVPVAESDLVVERLRALGRRVEYVTYPDEGHGFTRRATRLDAMRRMVAFLTGVLGRRDNPGP